MPDKHVLGRAQAREPVWRRVEPPVRPRRPPELVTVDDAYLTPVATGRLATVHRLNRWFTGAVYDAHDELVPTSQKILGDRRGTRVASDPDRVERRADAQRLRGTWLYGGTWASVFGHFLVETLTTLWPTLREHPAGLVFHSNFGPYTVDDWHRRYVELAGWGGLPIRVVGKQAPMAVDRLVVPGRSVALHAWAHPEARKVWERVARGFRGAGGGSRVYISRSRLNEERRRFGHRRPVRSSSRHDQALDRVFAGHGFDVVHPQELEVDEQLRAVGSASVLAGLCGSGLHQSAFIPPGGRVLELGDGRTGDRRVRMQQAIDAAMDHEACFLGGDTSPDDVDHALAALDL